jgi:Glycosyltransferase family 92
MPPPNDKYYLPPVAESARWANLRVCPVNAPLPLPSSAQAPSISEQQTFSQTADSQLAHQSIEATPSSSQPPPLHNWVICTWTASSYQRRGDVTTIDDTRDRLMEWILFYRMVGVDHIYIYDNTFIEGSSDYQSTVKDYNSDKDESFWPLLSITRQFPDFVTHHPWRPRVCNNNRPNHPNPGERSSQYAAEASCRERYGPHTKWMAFVDIDEYLVPINKNVNNFDMDNSDKQGNKQSDASNEENDSAGSNSDMAISWKPILAQKDKEGYKILKMKSSRGRPRLSMMEELPKEQECPSPRAFRRLKLDSCLWSGPNITFLQVYNCDYIKPPLPERFDRAMKQIYQPSHVLSHFVHYSTVTLPMTVYHRDYNSSAAIQDDVSRKVKAKYHQYVDEKDWKDVFLDELTEGRLVHAKSVLPYETRVRNTACQLGSKRTCVMGIPCPESTAFVDDNHTQNVFVDEGGKYCNCW